MHPETLRIYEGLIKRGADRSTHLMQTLVGPHHFHFRRSIIDVASQLANAEVSSHGNFIRFPDLSRLPCDRAIMTLECSQRPRVLSLRWDDKGRVVCSNLGDLGIVDSVAFLPGSNEMGIFSRNITQRSDAHSKGLALEISMILSLLNTPRIVKVKPADGIDWSRQHRRAVERLTGRAPFAFQTVSWELGKKVASVGNRVTTEGHRKALHWCRAHWRQAKAGQPGAQWVNVPWRGGYGWYVWVSDCWKGHPDYGVKLQRHEPRMQGDGASSVKAVAVLDDTRWKAMSSAYRASLTEAGFAPTCVVQ